MGRIMADEVLADGGGGPCSVLGFARAAPPAQAALCNGTAIHGFELDDLLPASIVHPGTVIVPAVLAAAEASNASGMTLLRGIVAGYECMSRLSLALGLEPSHRGFTRPASSGPWRRRSRAAWSWACRPTSSSARLASPAPRRRASRPTPAAAAGEWSSACMQAAQREACAWRVSLNAASPDRARRSTDATVCWRSSQAIAQSRIGLTQGLGEAWAMDGLWVKVYPICGWIQGVVQLLSAMRGPDSLALDQVEKVVVGTSAFAVKNNANRRRRTPWKRNTASCCCAVALQGDAGDPNEFGEQTIHDPLRRAFSSRVEVRIDEESEAVYPARFGSRVRLHLRSGK